MAKLEDDEGFWLLSALVVCDAAINELDEDESAWLEVSLSEFEASKVEVDKLEDGGVSKSWLTVPALWDVELAVKSDEEGRLDGPPIWLWDVDVPT